MARKGYQNYLTVPQKEPEGVVKTEEEGLLAEDGKHDENLLNIYTTLKQNTIMLL